MPTVFVNGGWIAAGVSEPPIAQSRSTGMAHHARTRFFVLSLIVSAGLQTWLTSIPVWAETQASSPSPDHERPNELWFTLEFDGAVEESDKELIRKVLESGALSLVRYFDDPDLTTALNMASVKVVIHAEPGSRASETKASVHSGTRSGGFETYYASVHVLAPASYSAEATTSIGEPKDVEYCKRLLIHELSTVPLDLATRIKAEGWRFHTGPSWFVQGYQEYLGMVCVPGEDGIEALDRRTRIVVAEPERVDDSFGLTVRGPYVTGAALLRFMHEQYGADSVKGILTSHEATFGRAVRASLGVNLDEFMRAWRAWLAKQPISSRTPKARSVKVQP